VKLSTINGEKIKTSAIVTFEYNAMLEVGDLITGIFSVSSIKDYAENSQYYLAKNVTIHLTPEADELSILHGQDDITIKISRINEKLSKIIKRSIDGESGNLISALLLGNKDLLSSETVRDFRRAGISHVIAISGMHLSVLMFVFDFILKKLRINKGTRGAVVFFASLFYLVLTGCALSTLRAFVMSAIVYLSYILSEDSDMLTNLLFALFFIIAISPFAVYDIGLWLSFLAVLGIFVADYFINKFSDYLYTKVSPKDKYARKMSPTFAKILKGLFSSVLITVFANVFICLPAWLYFNEISTISVLTNLVASPLVSLLLFLSPMFIALSPIAFLADAIALIIEKICVLLLEFISFVTSFEWATISLNYIFAGPIVIALAISLSLCLVLNLKRKWVIAIPPIVAGALFFVCLTLYNQYYDQITKVEFLGGKESEMFLIQDGNEHIIIDISSGAYSYSYNAYSRAVENCATEISSYVITHYHSRQINSLYKLARRTIIRELFLPYPQTSDEYYLMCSLISMAMDAGISIEIYDAYSDVSIGENTTLLLSSREFLERSMHPVFYLVIKANSKTVTYSAESLSDCPVLYEEASAVFNDSEFIFLGFHGPIMKNEFKLCELTGHKTIMITNQETLGKLIKDNLSNHTVVKDVSYAKIEIPKQ
jgi:ComEC/Rec2-related protein